MKKFIVTYCFVLAFFACCYLAYPAEPQEQLYQIRESQLQQLETMYHNSEASRQTALLLSSDLLKKAQTLQKDCSTLKTLLQAERSTTQTLTHSVSSLENSLQEQQKKYQMIQEENNGLQVKVEKLKRQKATLIDPVIKSV